MVEDNNEGMTFWDHLEELRWTLLRSIVAMVIFTIVGIIVMPYIYDTVILGPAKADFFLYKYLCYVTSSVPYLPDFCDNTFHVKLVNYSITSQFFRHMTTSFWMALVLTFPYLAFEIWRFVSPALYENEKKNIRWVFVFGTVMFFIGCFVGYALVFPMSFRFLVTYQLSGTIENTPSLDSYMDMFLMLVFIMGVVFELPLISWFLSKLGLLNRSFFNKFRRHAIVALLIAAAFITPSSDPFTLAVVFIPLYFLYELSAFFVKPAPKDDEIEDELEDGDILETAEEE